MVITIREKIFLRMKEFGVTSRALCMDLGFKESNFSAYLKGSRVIPLKDLEKVCMYLGLTLEKKEPCQDEETTIKE